MDVGLPGQASGELLERLRMRRREWEARGPKEASRRLAQLPRTAADLGTLLDVSLFATLLTEEGRPTRFACSYLDPEQLDGVPARRLANPLPLTAESIRRIAPAGEPSLSALGVWGTGDELCIWGLVDAPRMVSLRVFGLETGQLRVGFLGQTHMIYSGGTARVRTDQDPTFVTSIRLIAAAMGLVNPLWYRPRAILGLADALLQSGHGGAILVSRRPREEVRRRRINLTFPSFGPLTTLEEPVLETQEADPSGSPDGDLFKHFRSVDRQHDITRTARLAAVDGGVLCDPHLRVTGFGAMIDVRGMRRGARAYRVDLPKAMHHLAEATSDLSVVTERHQITLEECGGQRHQSAMRWCSTSRTAMLALVCSQDGTASVVAPIGTEGDVGVVMHIETSPDNW